MFWPISGDEFSAEEMMDRYFFITWTEEDNENFNSLFA